MRARADILGDTGKSAPENWDPIWLEDRVHVWVAVNARTMDALEDRCAQLRNLMTASGAARTVFEQNASALFINGKATTKEHFGYTDGFSNPSFEGDDRDRIPGQGKLTADGDWVPLATGEFLLEYAVWTGNQQVSTGKEDMGLLSTAARDPIFYAHHCNIDRLWAEWLRRNPTAHKNPTATAWLNTSFTFGGDMDGTRCPIGAHVRRVNPRDAQGFNGRLVNRRRIMRRGLPYGQWTPEDQPARDEDEHGIIFMALNASLYRQFEFVQQQWINYGNDAMQGNDRDPIVGNHDGTGKFMIQGREDPQNPPFLCAKLPAFVELRGGDYFFVPSLTALQLIASGKVDAC